MRLKTLLLILSVATSVIMLVFGGTLYYLITDRTREYSHHNTQVAARIVAAVVEGYLKQLDDVVDRIAEGVYPDFPDNSNTIEGIQTIVEAQSRIVPGLLRIRVLPPDIDQPDESQIPPMGYADLVMVKKALESNPQAAVHGAGTPHIHLAAARKIMIENRIVGVVLASYSMEQIKKLITGAQMKEGALELKQGDLSIGFSGEATFKNEPPTGFVKVRNNSWTVHYWIPTNTGPGPILYGSIVASALAGLILLFFIGYRWLKKSLLHDQTSIMNAARDVTLGNKAGFYPIKIKELEGSFASLHNVRQMMRSLSGQNDQDVLVDDGVESKSANPGKSASSEITMLPKEIFRAYDIRGVVGQSLTIEIVRMIGQAIGSEAQDSGQQTVIIARDGRHSSPDMSTALATGLQSSGCDVIDLGMVPTPLLYFATHFLESNSGVMVTGSHNPPDYNGLKMVIDGDTLSGDRIQRIYERIENDHLKSGEGSIETKDVISDYIGTICDDVQLGQPMKVVVDCGNGVAGSLAPILLRSIGCEVVELYCEVDGNFPNHHPDPSKPENLQDLIERVEDEKAHLGLAFDGDGDRLGVIDSAGSLIWPDRQMMLYAADVLSRQPGADIIFDVKCSKHLATEIVKHGGRPIMWKTGHSLIKAKIKEIGAQLAGEMSGHIFFKERWFGFDDALYTATRLLEILSADPRTSAEVFEELPNSINTPELNVTLEEGENFAFIDKLLEHAKFKNAKVTTIDGLRVDFADGWGLVRASNTTPSLVMRFEADSEEALERIQSGFKQLMLKVKPDLDLPY